MNSYGTVSESPGSWVAALRDVLMRLAAPAQAQIKYLTDIGVSPSADELALEFDDFYLPIRGELSESTDWKPALESLGNLDLSLESNELAWTTYALAHASEWESIRTIAATSLRLVDAAVIASKMDISARIYSTRPIR